MSAARPVAPSEPERACLAFVTGEVKGYPGLLAERYRAKDTSSR